MKIPCQGRSLLNELLFAFVDDKGLLDHPTLGRKRSYQGMNGHYRGANWRDRHQRLRCCAYLVERLTGAEFGHRRFSDALDRLLAQRDVHARAQGRTDRRNTGFRGLPIRRGIP